MTKKGFIKKGLLLMLTFSLTFVSVPVMAAEEAPVSVTTLAAAKNGWVKEKAGYCYYKNGKKVTNKLIKVNGKTYYVGANGVRKTGWYTVGNKSYYFASNGVCQKSKKIDAALVKAMSGKGHGQNHQKREDHRSHCGQNRIEETVYLLYKEF